MNGGERLGLEGMHVHVGRMQLTCGYDGLNIPCGSCTDVE